MGHKGRIITLGLTPAWDMTCRGSHLAWGEHPMLEQQRLCPAGKALNISLALAWLGQDSVATGLWGQEDYAQMQNQLQQVAAQISLGMTPVPGRTRINVTVLDRARSQELHLRCPNTLYSSQTLQALSASLVKCIRPHDTCILAGALPSADLAEELLDLCQCCVAPAHTRLVLDGHGPMFKALVETGQAWLIKPNVAELNELLGRRIRNTPACLAKAARALLDRVDMVLVSRGKLGAVLVTRTGAWQGRCSNLHRVFSTVGCGDFLLAGFVQALGRNARIRTALSQALKVASARAWGWPDGRTWHASQRLIKVDVQRL
jgi:1-phosphofructokinase